MKGKRIVAHSRIQNVVFVDNIFCSWLKFNDTHGSNLSNRQMIMPIRISARKLVENNTKKKESCSTDGRQKYPNKML